MAIVKFIQYKPGENATPSALRGVINYCLKPEKTEIDPEHKLYCTSGQKCIPELSYEQFMATKAVWGKESGVYFYHYVQSFAPNDPVTPELANEIGREFAKAWDGYEVLIATHIDREHIHNHFIVNSVSFETGKKLHQPPTTLQRLRKYSDELCIKYGLTVLNPYEKTEYSSTLGNGEYRSAKRGNSWKIRLRIAIGKAMEISGSREEFIENMRALGYDVRWEDSRKNITYTCLREKKFKDGKYPKCNDDKLTDKKYLKGEMEYEFEIRKTIILGGADEAERTNSQGRGENDSDIRGGMGTTFKSSSADGDADRAEEYGGKESDRDGEYAEKTDRGTDESREQFDPKDSDGMRRTGWESERERFKDHIRNGAKRTETMGSSVRGVRRNDSVQYGSLDLLRVASAGLKNTADDTNKTPEEIEAEERARLASQNIGAAVGLAAGIVIENLNKKGVNETDETTDDYEEQEAEHTMSM